MVLLSSNSSAKTGTDLPKSDKGQAPASSRVASPAPLESHLPTAVLFSRKRVAVFASYSADGFLPPQVLPYLAGLKPLTHAVVVVCDNDLAPGEREKLIPFATHVITGRHGEYDFGSYKRGVAWARDHGLLDDADDLILCNDSCFGPVGSFAPMFAAMEERNLDFWGGTDSHEFTYHLQSYWVVLSRKVFSSDVFRNFIEGVEKQENVQQVILNYELGLTKTLMDAGFTAGAMVSNTLQGCHPNDPSYNNLTMFPLYTLERGLPLVKVKALRAAHTNVDGPNRLLAWLRENAPTTYESAASDIHIKRFEGADDVAFSLILPTKDRAWCISRAIDSILAQTHRNFELIIVDDGSTDGTDKLIFDKYEKELVEGVVKYIPLGENLGVSNARNIGVSYAKNPWVGYVDSDNFLKPYYLTVMANSIIEHRDFDVFYGRLVNVKSGDIIGRPFSRNELLENNFIDLGVLVHRKSILYKFGGFDSNLRRLVDWDLVIRLTKHKNAIFVPRVFLEYYSHDKSDRISVGESFVKAKVYIHNKRSIKNTVSTAIISYNHQKYIVEAIESALAQKGDFTHEIIISDDGSTDGTSDIIKRYEEKYPYLIRRISSSSDPQNLGISENYKRCFRQASGEFLAVLEGDDYWLDEYKNMEQVDFLNSHSEAVMVFSRVELFDEVKGSHRLLKRQDGLGELLTGLDFANSHHLNLIANLSSSMFRKDVVVNMPEDIYIPRLNEISLGFYMDRIGKMGFIDKVMGIYRQNSNSVWTGASQASQLKQAIAIRENALRIARPAYQASIESGLREKRRQLAALESSGFNER